MPNFLLIFIILVISLSLIIILIGEIAYKKAPPNIDIDSQYYNADGDHIYYDRSLIEKKQFLRRFPHIKNLRSISRLFSREVEC